MILEKANELLGKLRTTNYRRSPDFGMDSMSETLIRIVSNECKSTILQTDDLGNVQSRRYESDIVKENLDQIIRQLILNGGTIPKEVMSNIMYSNGALIGVNSDIQLYKGFQEQENGEIQSIATIGNMVIDFSKLSPETLKHIEQEVYSRFSRQFILENTDRMPRLSKFSIFKEKLLHGRENRDFINQKFVELLKSETSYGDDIIQATAQYHLDHLYSSKFKKSLLESAETGSTLVPLESKGKNMPFGLLLEAMTAETQDMESIIPNINGIHKDISQAYADVEAQLMAYSIDLTKLDAHQIEQAIKQVNKATLQNDTLRAHLGESGYRNCNVGISNANINLVKKENVSPCMKTLSEDILSLVQSASTMDKDEYLKRAVQLNYRFIRIHPFPDSNGRTSRALLNMMTIPKGILVEVPKEKKAAFVQAQRDTNEVMEASGYFDALSHNPDALHEIEDGVTDLPTYEFIRTNCIIEIPSSVSQSSETQLEHQAEAPDR